MSDDENQDFYRSDFNYQDYLNDQTNANDLSDILKKLTDSKNRNANKMSQVLREQTDSVILIAEQLQNLHRKIENLHAPFSQLREVLKTLFERIVTASHDYEVAICENASQYNDAARVEAYKNYMINFDRVTNILSCYQNLSSDDFHLMERLISSYAFQMQFMRILSLEAISGNDQELDMAIIARLRDNFLMAFFANDCVKINALVDLFVFLDKLGDFYEIVTDDIIYPLLRPIFSEENLRRNQNKIETLYKRGINVLLFDLKHLIDITRESPLAECDIIMNCYWPAADELLRTKLDSVTAAGHADIFIRNYKQTVCFLQQLSEIQGDPNLIKHDVRLIQHLRRFNLNVYYEIRHQELSTFLETGLVKASKEEFKVLPREIKRVFLLLKISQHFFLNSHSIFHPNIFLSELSDQFLKSHLLFSARFLTAIQKVVDKYKDGDLHIKQTIYLTIASDLKTLEKALFFELTDELVKQSIYKPIDCSVWHQLRRVLKTGRDSFSKLYQNVKGMLVSETVSEIVKHLQYVTAIPRLYRRTNKSMPKEHSAYINDALKHLKTFVASTQPDFFTATFTHEIFQEVVYKVSDEYLKLVKEVLMSVCKTEESLRRLKSRNANISTDEAKTDGGGGGGGTTDEAKIRLQIKIDVAHLVAQIEENNIGKFDEHRLSRLLKESGNEVRK